MARTMGALRSFQLAGLEESFAVAEATIHEGLSVATRATVLLRLALDATLDAEAALATNVVLTMYEDDAATRAFHLVVREVLDGGESFEARFVTLELTDRFAMLDLRRDVRIFQELTSVEIVQQVFEGAGIAAESVEFRVQRALPKRNYCVQYRETDAAFVERLADFEGIFSIAADSIDEPKTIFADDRSAFVPIDGDPTLLLADTRSGSGVYELDITHSVVTEEVVLRDWNYETPGVDLTSSAADGEARTSRYEFPGGFQTQSDGAALAAIRLEEHLSRRLIAHGFSDDSRLRPGRTFELSGASRTELNVSWLVRSLTHRFRQVAGGLQTYECAFEAAFADQPFRPPRRHAWPVVPGSHSVKVTGPAGEEIHTDALGRMKGKFYWDRVGDEDDQATCWMRVVQLPLGSSQALARVGWEMLVRYAYGDPDRPIAVARVDNGAHLAPYAYPAAASAMSFKTLSSPGGGKFNELTMEDGGGGMKFGATASKDWHETTNNNKTEKIGVDDQLTVGTTLDVAVTANQTIKVGASRTCTISSDANAKVKGDRTKTVGGAEIVSISGTMAETTKGSDSETTGAGHLTVSGLGITRSSVGSHSLTVGGTYIQAAALGCNIAVAGALSETVGAAKLVISGGPITESIIGAGAITVGGAIVHAAGGNRTASAKGSTRVTVGGVALINAGGKFVMKGRSIKITVAGIANLLGGGGVINLTPGSATFAGLVTIKGSSVVKIGGNPNLMT
jgi:type VI secretion system secreted protein VgrG